MANWFDVKDDSLGLPEVTQSVVVSVEDEDVLATLRAINRANRLLIQLAQDVIEIAGSETRISQRKLADALGVSPRVLTGLRS